MRPHRFFLVLLVASLLATGCASPADVGRSEAPAAAALDPVSSPEWTADMTRFAEQDAANPPPAAPVVFTGSSSIRLWTTLAEDFPDLPVLNRGFGGSQVRDSVWYADQVAIRYQPRRIVLYAGDNDINAGRTPQQVSSDFRAFVARIRRDLPKVPIVVLSIKPSLARLAQLPRQREANALLKADAAALPGVTFVDIATPMLDADGKPRAELFGEDGLHMNRQGYDVWRSVVAPYLR